MAIANHSQFIAFRNSSRFSEWRPQFIAFHNRVAIAAFHRVTTAIHCVSAFNSELRPQFIAFHRFFDCSLARSRDSLRLAFFDRSLRLSHLFEIRSLAILIFRSLALARKNATVASERSKNASRERAVNLQLLKFKRIPTTEILIEKCERTTEIDLNRVRNNPRQARKREK